MHNLLQFWDVTESIATLTTDLSVFGPLLVWDKSYWVDAPENRSRVCFNVKSSPYETLYISILDLRRRSVITSGSRVSGGCQHKKGSMTASQMSTHYTVAEFINRYQVVVVNKYHVAVRCPLQITSRSGAYMQ
jgi:hypothetical protein